MRVRIAVVAAVAALSLLVTAPAFATAGKGNLYYQGAVVRTVVVPAPVPGGGTDPLYSVTNGVPGQLGIAGVAPGAPGYHGGAWAVYQVTFQPGVTPYLLTSAAAVMAAEDAGDVTVTRTPSADFRCPIQP
jgi:hypothetical protein